MPIKRLSALGSLLILAVGCGIAIRRDLSAVPAGQVGFDDMCGLQGYFDALEIKTSPAPRVVSALDLEGSSGGKTLRGGKERFAFESDFQLKHLKRVLDENWRRLPEAIAKASEVEIEVRWAEKAGTKRVITSEDAEIAVGAESWSLPYHPCLSELLYGEPLYRQRREMWGLPLPATPRPVADGGASPAAPDGGH
jgi:lambda repressor-like predicted transcriptional regulator